MKSLLIALFVVASSAQAATYVCPMKDTTSRPYLTFVVKFPSPWRAEISYQKNSSFASEEFSVRRPVPGCGINDVQFASETKNSLMVECRADGDAGVLEVKRSNPRANLEGNMSFPNTGIEGFSDMDIPVFCRKQN